MTYKIILHIQNTDAVLGEVEKLPTPTDSLIEVHNPTRVDGKDLNYLADNVRTVYWPIERLNFIELLSDGSEDQIFGFVRE